MVFALEPKHVGSLLTLYRMLLRHANYLPSDFKDSTLGIIRKEFKSHRNVRGKLLRERIALAYDCEKDLFEYHTGKSDLIPIEKRIADYSNLYESRRSTLKIKKKPTIIESYPQQDAEVSQTMQNEQRLDGLIDKLIKSDQAKSLIPHKSLLDWNYVRHIYGARVLHMKASQLFRRCMRLLGPDSKPPAALYRYNFSSKLTLLTLRTPAGSFKEFDSDVYKINRTHVDYIGDNEALELYKQNYGKWAEYEDEWDASITLDRNEKRNIKMNGYYSNIKRTAELIAMDNQKRLENDLKFHNRKVMFVKSKLKKPLQEYHAARQQNFSKMLEFISQHHINEFNDYSNSLSMILTQFGFKHKTTVFNVEKFDSKLDPKEFDWEVEPNYTGRQKKI